MTHDEPTPPPGGPPPVPPPRAAVGRFEVADGDLVRCGLAPYLFRARRDGGAMLLEPVGAGEAAALLAAADALGEDQA
jgi:hypothetical protein